MALPNSDRFRNSYAGGDVGGVDWPATRAVAVTPDDSVDLAFVTRAIWVGTGGDVEVIFEQDTVNVVIVNVPDGTLLPFRVSRIRAGATTASNILALD